MSDKPPAKPGRPSKADEVIPEQLELLAAKGWTDQEIAEFYKVTRQTVCNWKNARPEIFDTLKAGKEFADRKVERSLYEKATGYSHPDVHISNFQGEVTITPIIKHYAPDTTAAIFWLKNRKAGEWRDKQDHEHGVTEEMAEILKRIRSRE